MMIPVYAKEIPNYYPFVEVYMFLLVSSLYHPLNGSFLLAHLPVDDNNSVAMKTFLIHLRVVVFSFALQS